MVAPGVRAGLLVLALSQGVAALFAMVAPRSFYDDFPVAGADWVSALPPFNEHLVRDYGASFAALALLALLAAWLADRRLVAVTCAVWLVSAVPHLVFHLANADAPGGFSGAVSLVALAFNVALPLLLLSLIRKEMPDVAHPTRAR